jgi:threonine/homoserine efflux transporter RhtA
MKRYPLLLALLVALAALSGWLMSHLNVIGRIGVNWIHQEYKFLKVWWQGGGLVLAVWLVLLAIHALFQSGKNIARARIAHGTSLFLAIVGLWFTYQDFRTDFTHRIIGERFHLGAYLFWIGWMLIALFFLTAQKRRAAL